MTTLSPSIHQKPQTIGHVGINVTDLERSLAFYQAVLNLDVLKRNDGEPGRFILLGTEQTGVVLTLWEQASDNANPSIAGLHHLAFQAESVQAVKEAETNLRSQGAEILHGGAVPVVEGAAGASLFFLDPDGTRIEISTSDDSETLDADAPFGEAPTCGFF